MPRPIIPAHLAIKAMRDSGYKDAAHAIAELVDNSIQAGAQNVQILCADRTVFVDKRSRQNLDQIAVIDDGCGMSSEVLEMALQFGNGTHLEPGGQDGIGKFGMGLPNSSISQCRRVDVWTWQDGRVITTFLDLDQVERGEMVSIPEPEESQIPEVWRELIGVDVGDSGTLVVWSRPDRVRWKTSRALLSNSEHLLGRMYRHFIHRGEVEIRLTAFVRDEQGSVDEASFDELCRANDPLYLMSRTSCPEPFQDRPMFDRYGPTVREMISIDGVEQFVEIRFAITKKEARELGGGRAHGRHAKKNVGVSVVRADRELSLDQTFINGYDPRERWWGVEVRFPPALDEVFGVTNNKQGASKFGRMNLDEDAEAEGMSPEEFKDRLRDENDPRLIMYEISRVIDRNLNAMRDQVTRMKEGSAGRGSQSSDGPDPVEEAATRATEERASRGFAGRSDADEDAPNEQRIQEVVQEIRDASGLTEEEALAVARFYIEQNVKYIFREGVFDGAAFFSVQSRGGEIIIHVNKRHPVATYLYDILEESVDERANRALFGLKLLFCAWARMEDETQSEERRHALSDLRADWGRIARDFLLQATA